MSQYELFSKSIHRDEFRLRILMTNGCNKKCQFCLNDFQDKPVGPPQFINVSDANRAIAAYCYFMRMKGEEPIITFSGGEPGIHPKIHHILSIARANGAFIKLVTNGTALYLTELKKYVDCWHVGVTKPNYEIIDFLKTNPGYNIQFQYVLLGRRSYNVRNVIDFYCGKGYTLKIWTNFFLNDNSREISNKAIEKLVDEFPDFNIISRYTGIQENRGKACEGCTTKCVTLKALWVFPDGSASTCPQGVKKRGRPTNWTDTISKAYEDHMNGVRDVK